MSVFVKWDNDQHTIIQLILEGRWTLEEAYNGLDELYAAIEAEAHTVHVLVDVINGSNLPANLLSMRGTIARKRPPNSGITAVAGGGAALRAIANMINRLVNESQPYVFRTNTR